MKYLALLLIILCASPARSENAPTPQSENSYRLGSGDVLEITVENHDDLNRVVTVDPDGAFSFPSIGTIAAKGLTIKQLESQIQSNLNRTFNNATVLINLKEMKAHTARVIGSVQSPGTYPIHKDERLLDLLASAGGLAIPFQDAKSSLIRDQNQIVHLDLPQAISKPASVNNPPIHDGDLLIIEKIERINPTANVIGQAVRAGSYPINGSTTVTDLLAEAGGATPLASLSETYIQRGHEKFHIDLEPLLQPDRSLAPITTFTLKNGDTLVLPEVKAKYLVIGMVVHPAAYPLHSKQTVTVLEALASAGGHLPDADLSRSFLLHKDSATNAMTVNRLNLDRLLRDGKNINRIVISAGDTLYIPAKGRPFDWQNIYGPLSSLAFMGLRLFY